MTNHQVEELRGKKGDRLAWYRPEDARPAVEKCRPLQEPWFRMADEAEGTVYEFSIAEGVPKDFAK